MSFKKIDPKMKFPQMEEEILKFWEENKIFEKSLENRKGKEIYSFYDGPPFATGTPHYGHIVGSIIKDAIPRFWTMRGYYVPRKWGWDCHGLPIENIAEKELGIKRKKEIEEIGVAKFNDVCRSKVLEYVEEWKKVIRKLARWADMENSYRTMDLPYMETIWWVFKDMYEKGLIYEGYRSMLICPRCETTLSQSEVAEGYKDIKDLSVIAKFELMDEPGTFVLAWTTTPWTLIGNVALAIGKDIDYVKLRVLAKGEQFDANESEYYIMAKDRIADVFKEVEYEIVEEYKGNNIIGKKYKPLFDYYSNDEKLKNRENGWKIYAADFVTTEEGTGVVHIAPAFGEDDLNLGKENDLPFIQHVGMDGLIKPEAGEFSGLHVKPEEDTQKTDVEIIKYLAAKNLLFAKEKYEHSYPHCWRCETPLINFATSSWFVEVSKFRNTLLETAKEINWSPKHIKEGRFGNWLEGARDWSISRQRYWASAIPIWRCDCGEIKVIGSLKELEEVGGKKVDDIHKHIVDEIEFPCEKCGGTMKRIPDVLDCWFDSGSMPYAQAHYPFEDKEEFEQTFPADFIAEGIDQTRTWFYYLHVVSGAVRESNSFKNVIVNGIVLAEDGKKMSKRLNNYPDPLDVIGKYGADSLRFYLASAPVVSAENMNFKEAEVADVTRGMMRMLWNSYSFFVMYASIDNFQPKADGNRKPANNLLDKWILSELNILIKDVNLMMENYELHRATRLFPGFIDNLSNWYIRRSRKRFWKSENDSDKNEAYETLHQVLVTLAKLMAPFTPFIAEEIYKNLTEEESVHLADFPVADEKMIDEKLNEIMKRTREIISAGLEQRSKAGIKVRQPLSELLIKGNLENEYLEIIKDEVNVKKVIRKVFSSDSGSGTNEGVNAVFQSDAGIITDVILNSNVTPELKLEGQAREVIRRIQEMRKEAGFEVDNRIILGYDGGNSIFDVHKGLIAKEVLSDSVDKGKIDYPDLEKEFKIDGEEITISIKKV
jgi:isoleucyl-tRNA synthetase